MKAICLSLLVVASGCSKPEPPPSFPGSGKNTFHGSPLSTAHKLSSKNKLTATKQEQAEQYIMKTKVAVLEKELQSLPGNSAIKEQGYLRLAGHYRHTQNLPALQTALARITTPGPKRTALQRYFQAATKPARRIAVLLPLSGTYSSIGQGLKLTIELARAQLPPLDKDNAIELVFLDTAGSEEGARAAALAAFYEHRAAAILGPVGKGETMAVLHAVASTNIPVFHLSPHHSSSPDRKVFAMATTLLRQADTTAELAWQMNYKVGSVLAPRTTMGKKLAEQFITSFRTRGGKIASIGQYDPSRAQMESDIKAFLGLSPQTNPRLRRHLQRWGKGGWKSFSPKPPFEFIYIPDSPHRATLITSYLAYYNIELDDGSPADETFLMRKHGRLPQRVALFGSREWHSQALFARGGPSIVGAFFVDSFFGANGEDASSESAAMFAQLYRQKTGNEATSTAAEAFQVTQLLLLSFQKSFALGADGRGELFKKLIGFRLDGPCGPFEITPSGLKRSLTPARVDDNVFALDIEY